MKKNYISPKAIVCEMATNDAILTKASPGMTTSDATLGTASGENSPSGTLRLLGQVARFPQKDSART